MPRPPDSGLLNFDEFYLRLQRDLSARLSLASLVEHASAAGSTAESHWIDFLNLYLPPRYRATPAFLFNAAGQRSRQIDIAIYDHLHAPPLFPRTVAVHIPVETVHAIFEVKSTFSRQWLDDAADKAASVRALTRRTRRRIYAGLLAKSSVWNPETFSTNLRRALQSKKTLDLGCSLDQGAFAREPKLAISSADNSVHFFLFSLLYRLDARAPAPNLQHYWKPRP